MQIRSEVLRKVANGQTDKQRRLHILLGGGNKYMTPNIAAHITCRSTKSATSA